MNNIYSNNDSIIFDFSYFRYCFRSTRIKGFTNYLENQKDFFSKFKRFIENDLEHICQCTFDNVYVNTNKHSHIIKTDDEHYKLVLNILENIVKETDNRNFELFIDNCINDYQLWQLGVSSGIRVIGSRYMNVFRVLFFDYNHLLYPDKNYNDKNYKEFNFNPMEVS